MLNKIFWSLFLCLISIFLFKEEALYLIKQITLEKNISLEKLQEENIELSQKLLSLPLQKGKIITQMGNDDLLIIKSDLPINAAVFGKKGVIGKIIKNTKYTQKIRLITNRYSKIPVVTPGIARAILKGTGNGKLTLDFIEYTSSQAAYNKDDIIYTLGLEGIFPKHHPIAIVESVENEKTIICKPYEDIDALSYVSLLNTK